MDEGDFTLAQLEEGKRLQSEMPRIEDAVRNFLSLKMAEGLTGAGETAAAPPTSLEAAAKALTGCARILLKAINALDLPAPPVWSTLFPQGEAESGSDFMDRIAAYKVTQALWTRCRAAGQKPAKLLGLTAMRHAYPQIDGQLRSDLAASARSASASEEQVGLFLDGFASALLGPGLRSADKTTIVDDVDDTLVYMHGLIWAADFKGELARRHQARKTEAVERTKRSEAVDDLAAEVRSAFRAQIEFVPGGAASSTIVEEVEDEPEIEEEESEDGEGEA